VEFALLVISILLFAAVGLFILGIFYNIEYRRGRWKLIERMEQRGEQISSEEEKATVFPMIKDRLLRITGSVGEKIKPKSEEDLSHLRKTFLKAGYRRESAPIIFFGMKGLLAILLALIFFLVKTFFLKTMTSLNLTLFSLIFALIGFYLPNLWVQMRIARRKEQILKGFPDALDLMVVCVEAGTGLDAAVNRVGEEMKLSNKVLSEEFKLLSLELRAGKPRRDALRNLALRTDLEDVNSLMTLLIQTEKFGTSIGQALRVYSDSMRTKRYQKAEEIAAKLPVKLVFPLVIFIFPALFVVVVGPAAIKIYKILLPALGGH
jgi:tight adherence protein C